jgi:hypothetical protein
MGERGSCQPRDFALTTKADLYNHNSSKLLLENATNQDKNSNRSDKYLQKNLYNLRHLDEPDRESAFAVSFAPQTRFTEHLSFANTTQRSPERTTRFLTRQIRVENTTN